MCDLKSKRRLVLGAAVWGAVACGSDSQQAREAGSGTETGIDAATASQSGSATATATDSASGGSETSSASGGSNGEGVPKFDVAAPAGDADCGGAGGGGIDFSYIWIANTGDSPQTVSKINTETLVEEGRYITRDDGNGSPSRTSVALSGHAAVGNRNGGVTKFLAYGCPAGSTSPGGPDTELPWGMEACMAWSTNMPYGTQRPVAWAPGTYNEQTCQWEDELLWTSGSVVGGDTINVLRLDGDTGAILDTVMITEPVGTYGAYGGAVDGDGNFWFSKLSDNRLWRVDAVTLAVEVLQSDQSVQAYGIQVDYKGRPWLCGHDGVVARYTPGTNTWTHASTGGAMYGCMPDDEFLWIGSNASPPNVRAINLETLAVERTHLLDTSNSTDIHGTSIDFDGNIWGVNRGSMAFRIDPVTGAYDVVDGLDSPYTYSDMTGFALSNVGGPQG